MFPEYAVPNDIYNVLLVFDRKYGLHRHTEHLVTRKYYRYFIIWTQPFSLLQTLAVPITETGSYRTDNFMFYRSACK